MSSLETKRRLSKAKRQEHILAECRVSPTLRVSALASDLGVSTETIRRDLDELTERGLISRTYGGAVRPYTQVPTLWERNRIYSREREAIAARAARLVSPNEVIALGPGSTATHVARRMAAECRDLTVVTNSLAVATALSPNPTIKVLLCPGYYDDGYGCVVGTPAIEFLRTLHVNRAILGATGLTDEGPNEVHTDLASVHRVMMERALETIIVADHSKFNQPTLALFGSWNGIDQLVTDRPPTGALARALERHRVTVLVAPPREQAKALR